MYLPDKLEEPKDLSLKNHISPEKLLTLMEVYVDDFIAVCQAKTIEELRHATRSLLHGIDSIFPNGISIKKLLKEGKWEARKEILGWLFDGIARTMQLPNEKIAKTKAGIKKHIRRGCISNKELERLNGYLRHAALAMPWANGLFAPINNTLTKNVNMQKLKDGNPLKGALEDFSTIISAIAAEPTPLAQLIPAYPDVLGKVDASKKGAGGIWWSTNNEFPPTVWQVEFPPELQRNLEHQAKGNVNATNSD